MAHRRRTAAAAPPAAAPAAAPASGQQSTATAQARENIKRILYAAAEGAVAAAATAVRAAVGRAGGVGRNADALIATVDEAELREGTARFEPFAVMASCGMCVEDVYTDPVLRGDFCGARMTAWAAADGPGDSYPTAAASSDLAWLLEGGADKPSDCAVRIFFAQPPGGGGEDDERSGDLGDYSYVPVADDVERQLVRLVRSRALGAIANRGPTRMAVRFELTFDGVPAAAVAEAGRAFYAPLERLAGELGGGGGGVLQIGAETASPPREFGMFDHTGAPYPNPRWHGRAGAEAAAFPKRRARYHERVVRLPAAYMAAARLPRFAFEVPHEDGVKDHFAIRWA
jgi:hypothetical protein